MTSVRAADILTRETSMDHMMRLLPLQRWCFLAYMSLTVTRSLG